MYFIDVSEGSGREPVDDLKALRREIEAYGKGMDGKPGAVAANKMDALEDPTRLAALEEAAAALGLPFFAVSAATGDGCQKMVRELYGLVQKERVT